MLLISDGGTLVRTRASEISQVGRNTQGVTLMRLAADETLQAVERVDASLDEDIDVADAAVTVGRTVRPSDVASGRNKGRPSAALSCFRPIGVRLFADPAVQQVRHVVGVFLFLRQDVLRGCAWWWCRGRRCS